MLRRLRVFRLILAILCIGAGITAPGYAQDGVTVEIKEISDARDSGERFGQLELTAELAGTELDEVDAARLLVKEATDDKGNDLREDGTTPEFQSRDTNMGSLKVSLRNPARAAKSMSLSGTVELFIPSKDPNAVVTIEKALTKLDTPLRAEALEAEKISIRLLSPETYGSKQEENKLDDAKIAELRERAKKEGLDEKEFEEMVAFAKAFEEIGGGKPPDGAVILAGRKTDFDRILRIRVLTADGEEVSFPSRSTSSLGDDATMVLEPSEPPPADATLELTLLTRKATMSVPFTVSNIELP